MSPDSFVIEIVSTGARFKIPPDLPILDVLEREGFRLDFGCRIGKCAVCRQRAVGGEILHYDSCLSDEQRGDEGLFCPCVSRAPEGTVLRIDL